MYNVVKCNQIVTFHIQFMLPKVCENCNNFETCWFQSWQLRWPTFHPRPSFISQLKLKVGHTDPGLFVNEAFFQKWITSVKQDREPGQEHLWQPNRALHLQVGHAGSYLHGGDIYCRVLILGAAGVGKSSLCSQFLSSEHINTYATVGEFVISGKSSSLMRLVFRGLSGEGCGAGSEWTRVQDYLYIPSSWGDEGIQ